MIYDDNNGNARPRDAGRAASSAVERCFDIAKAEGSIPSPPTKAYLLIPLTRGMTAKIDPDDGPMVGPYKWSVNETVPGRFYARTTDQYGRTVYLHRLILGLIEGAIADHRNGDTLDCRRRNLRVATASENSANARRERSKSGYIGVTMRKNFRYQAKIKHKGAFVHIGYFSTPEDAARAYDTMAAEFRGAFAVLNFPTYTQA